MLYNLNIEETRCNTVSPNSRPSSGYALDTFACEPTCTALICSTHSTALVKQAHRTRLAAFPPVFLGLHRQLAEDHQFYHLHSTRHPSSKSYILECARIRREHKSSVSSKMKHFIWHYLFCHVAKSLSVLCVKRPMVMNKLTCLYLQ